MRFLLAKKIALVIVSVLLAMVAVLGCASGPSSSGGQGAMAGIAVGGTAGALIDQDNRWRGGIIGGALGAVLGGLLGEISDRAAHEAAQAQKPVQYTSQSGRRQVVAKPAGAKGDCKIVTERYYENGKLVRTVEREVCD
ncbi:MAG: glycine zipper 2TM domain-containing protein [Desulfarculaceae bacterium]